MNFCFCNSFAAPEQDVTATPSDRISVRPLNRATMAAFQGIELSKDNTSSEGVVLPAHKRNEWQGPALPG